MIIRVGDVETTGLTPADAIVEVATLDLVEEGTGWQRGGMWSTLVNPGRPIPPEASAIHHITDADVAGAPAWADVRHKLVENLDLATCYFAAHNARFDLQFLDLPKDLRTICTYKVALKLWPDCPRHGNQVLRYWLALKLADPALAAPHRAPGDAYVTAAILARAFREFVVTPDDLVAISAEPALLPRLTFGEHAMKPLADVPTGYLEWITTKMRDPDPDVFHTAKCHLHDRRQAARNRSPVTADPPKEAT